MSVPVLLYHDLGPGVSAFSTTRHGGYSSGSYGEFNINRYCGDNPGATEKNLVLLCRELGIETERLIMPHQTHGTEIRIIAPEFFMLPDDVKERITDGVDALMTDAVGVCVGVSTADCIPVLLYDERHHACCAVHAGWRGTAARITSKAVAAMEAAYHTVPSELRACIGPGISLEHFEVGDEVYDKFAAAGFNTERVCRKYDKWHIDLWECNRIQLEEAGLNPPKILMTGMCTYSHADDYFSARRLGVASGRIFTGIIIR